MDRLDQHLDGGIHGQTNVGHWVRDAQVAAAFMAYWDLLRATRAAQRATTARRSSSKNNAFARRSRRSGRRRPTWRAIPPGITPVFSPRSGLRSTRPVRRRWSTRPSGSPASRWRSGSTSRFKQLLEDNTPDEPDRLPAAGEGGQRRTPSSQGAVRRSERGNNVYEAWGSFPEGPALQWARETNARAQLNQHVSYIHSKFLLMDPLGDDPIVVTGSANFSDASTNDNDENMLIIRGDRRVADIYFTEFNRLFNHYYFRSVQERSKKMLNAAEEEKPGPEVAVPRRDRRLARRLQARQPEAEARRHVQAHEGL